MTSQDAPDSGGTLTPEQNAALAGMPFVSLIANLLQSGGASAMPPKPPTDNDNDNDNDNDDAPAPSDRPAGPKPQSPRPMSGHVCFTDPAAPSSSSSCPAIYFDADDMSSRPHKIDVGNLTGPMRAALDECLQTAQFYGSRTLLVTGIVAGHRKLYRVRLRASYASYYPRCRCGCRRSHHIHGPDRIRPKNAQPIPGSKSVLGPCRHSWIGEEDCGMACDCPKYRPRGGKDDA